MGKIKLVYTIHMALNNCKHCGGRAAMIRVANTGKIYIECTKCGVRTGSLKYNPKSEKKLIDIWNRDYRRGDVSSGGYFEEETRETEAKGE